MVIAIKKRGNLNQQEVQELWPTVSFCTCYAAECCVLCTKGKHFSRLLINIVVIFLFCGTYFFLLLFLPFAQTRQGRKKGPIIIKQIFKLGLFAYRLMLQLEKALFLG